MSSRRAEAPDFPCAASPMVANKLARHPLLLDELLDPNTLISRRRRTPP
ncbi:hypothetical protein ACNKHS_18340 [Shigella flexneri]